jgi:UDP-N-acetylglucosamine--N-acetylmuramyl-(pentapeptide) pyrophosphoryl-undecaprenol N-acetylglucosamine transferase
VLNVAGERPALRDDLASTDVLPAGPVQYCTVDYLPDAISALAASDFYIGRSGAATVGELIASGVPALLIPDPQHIDQQQLGNAQVLVRRGQGHVLPQDEVSGAVILDWLKLVWDSPRVEPPSPPAADSIADDLLNAWEEPCA